MMSRLGDSLDQHACASFKKQRNTPFSFLFRAFTVKLRADSFALVPEDLEGVTCIKQWLQGKKASSSRGPSFSLKEIS
jgi:hypothetical protein